MVFGRADIVADQLKRRGLDVEAGDMGLDWIINEVKADDEIVQKYERGVEKGYVKHRDFISSYKRGNILIEDYVKKARERADK